MRRRRGAAGQFHQRRHGRQSAAGHRSCGLPKTAAVCDIVYNPLETPLLKDAAARGHKTIDGLGMLMHQAVPSFEAFFGVKPKVTPALREALVKVLRDRRDKPFVIGLTGSIGMGKSETARLFAAEGVPVFDADAAIHELYAGEAAAMIEAAFPGTTRNGAVDRAALSRQRGGRSRRAGTAGRPDASPGGGKAGCISQAARARPSWCWIFRCCWKPGLKVDAVVVATAPEHVQRERVLARPGMTEAKFAALLGAPDERCGKACTGALSGDHRQGLGSRPRTGENDPGRHKEPSSHA